MLAQIKYAAKLIMTDLEVIVLMFGSTKCLF